MLLTGLSASIPALKIYHPVWEFLLKRQVLSHSSPKLSSTFHQTHDNHESYFDYASWPITTGLSLQPLWSLLTGLHQSPPCSWEHWVCFLLRAFALTVLSVQNTASPDSLMALSLVFFWNLPNCHCIREAFPSYPICNIKWKWKWSCSVMSNSLQPQGP